MPCKHIASLEALWVPCGEREHYAVLWLSLPTLAEGAGSACRADGPVQPMLRATRSRSGARTAWASAGSPPASSALSWRWPTSRRGDRPKKNRCSVCARGGGGADTTVVRGRRIPVLTGGGGGCACAGEGQKKESWRGLGEGARVTKLLSQASGPLRSRSSRTEPQTGKFRCSDKTALTSARNSGRVRV